MSQETAATTTSISTKQMRETIQRSGYLLEQRVEAILTKEWAFVETNPIFPDPDTGKSREIDIDAISATQIYKKGYNFVFPKLLCECVNNPQPLVFFTRESLVSFLHHEQVKVSGIPVKFWGEDEYISFSEFTGMGKFHHYCKGPTATQYCTFQLKKNKSSWMALHSEEQHDTFSSLLKAIDYEIAQHFDSWYLPDKVDEEGVNVQIYYPLVIIQGSLYSATLKNNHFFLRKSKHIQFRKQLFLSRTNKVETYQIDVINEGFLPDYLKIVDSEMERVKNILQRRRADVLLSIEKIVEEAKSSKRKQKSYREYLEF
ncbi:MAG: hypothetical protein IMY77_03325 [Chloroflexi bacterium]|nr:hypothetical protein [Chloroflexota bacterium]